MGVNNVLVYCISIQKGFLCSDIWQGIHKELGQRKEKMKKFAAASQHFGELHAVFRFLDFLHIYFIIIICCRDLIFYLQQVQNEWIHSLMCL